MCKLRRAPLSQLTWMHCLSTVFIDENTISGQNPDMKRTPFQHRYAQPNIYCKEGKSQSEKTPTQNTT